jgi:16S rRNA (guanine966-N2)-methyltransferase
LFAILAARRGFAGTRVLDLYAGTGALAFEALSRGAIHATLVEPARAAVEVIVANAKGLGLASRVRVVATTVERAATALGGSLPFDLIFADPPYALVTSGDAPRALSGLLRDPLLAPDARLVLEHGKADAAPGVTGFRPLDTRRYGDTVLSFYVRGNALVSPLQAGDLAPEDAPDHDGG